MVEKAAARAAIAELIEKFRSTPKNIRNAYSEQQTREYYILPLFRALGWSTENPQEFTAEEQISRGFVDFGFYLNGVPAFYLETKRIKEGISKPDHMKQAINYAYLKGVTWAVLTDFEEIMVFNAEWEESSPAKARFLSLQYEEYANGGFDHLWYLSRSSMQTREIDRFAESVGKKNKKQAVTDVLFKQLTQWRRDLFSQMKLHSAPLWGQNPHEVDNAVQKFIDRLIFIRTAEDRGIEKPRLQEVIRQPKRADIYPKLRELFREMDGVYNSNLFAPHPVDNMEIHDPDLLREIIDGLYKPIGGYVTYDFNAISADVLGAVYEQYLGFKAQDPKGEQALDPRKQQKRKQQGIYYTPQFVVRYIVQSTLGKLLTDGADAHTLRVLDPACGSGSFLIEAFDVLDRHLARVEPDVAANVRRRRILTENLYGVDLDEQAVEVTRLNLALRAALERGKLPLMTHIQRGNSLIDDKAIAADAAFKWDERFADVMGAGGFDVVIGNPPYIRIQNLPHDQVAWMSERYESAAANYDIYIPFVERGLTLLNEKGFMSYILPHKFFNAQYGKNLRRLISKGKHLAEVVHFGDQQIFEGATTYTCIMNLSKAARTVFHFTKVEDVDKWILGNGSLSGDIKSEKVVETEWNFVVGAATHLYDRLTSMQVKLGDISNPFVGLQTSADTVFLFKSYREILDGIVVDSVSLNAPVLLESGLLKLVIRSGSIDRYSATPTALVLFPYEFINGKARLIPKDVMQKKYPKTWSYLTANEELLRSRENRRFDGDGWYQLYPKNLDLWEQPKIMLPYMITRLAAYVDLANNYFVNVTTGGFGVTIAPKYGSLHYFTGLFNSKLLDFFLKIVSTNFNSGYFAANKQYISQLPIRPINHDDPADKARHDRMVQMVERMLQLQQTHASAEDALNERRHELSEEIAALDKQIDTLVYELYGLTDDEIRIVEGVGSL